MERRPMKLYLVRHAEYGETTANGRCKYDAIIAAARQWRARWTQIARECEFKRKQEKQDETLVKMTERVVKLEGDSARTNKRLEILESHDYGGSK